MKYRGVKSWAEYSALTLPNWSNVDYYRAELERDSAYVCEVGRHKKSVISTPPFLREEHGFTTGLPQLFEEKSAIELPWVEVEWDKLLLLQPTVFSHVLSWYMREILSGKRIIPGVVAQSKICEGQLVLIGGTHRTVAMYELLQSGVELPLLPADEDVVMCGYTPRMVVHGTLYAVDEITRLDDARPSYTLNQQTL